MTVKENLLKRRSIKTASPPVDVYQFARWHGRITRPNTPSNKLIYVTGNTDMVANDIIEY